MVLSFQLKIDKKIWEKVLELSGEDTEASHLLSYGEALVSQNIEKKSEYLISDSDQAEQSLDKIEIINDKRVFKQDF